MTKAELIGQVAENANLSKKDAEAAIDATFEAITKVMIKKEKIQISGFGSFATKFRAERTGTNPATGAKMVVKASTAPVFKASKNLKEKVDK
jgi:DNA-binding protein HU-beta